MVERNTRKLLESARMWHSGQRGRPNNGSSNSWWNKDHFSPRAPNNISIYNANFAFGIIYNTKCRTHLSVLRLFDKCVRYKHVNLKKCVQTNIFDMCVRYKMWIWRSVFELTCLIRVFDTNSVFKLTCLIRVSDTNTLTWRSVFELLHV